MTERDMGDAIQRELEQQETVVWMGRPNPGRMTKRALPALIFAIPWLGITGTFSWQFLSHAGGSPGISIVGFMLFISIFWLVGLGILLAPVFAYVNAKNIAYAITNKRVLILTLGRARKLDSYGPRDLCTLEHIELNDGSGDLTFAQRATASRNNQSATIGVSFIGIPQVRTVEALMRQTFEANSLSPGSSAAPNDWRPISS